MFQNIARTYPKQSTIQFSTPHPARLTRKKVFKDTNTPAYLGAASVKKEELNNIVIS